MKKKEVATVYSYVGINPKGRRIKGEINEKSISLARLALKKQGITAKSIRARANLGFLTNKKITTVDIAVFARQLATMLRSGISLIEAFDIVIDGITNQALRSMIVKIKNEVEGGSPLSTALKAHPFYFDSLFCALVAAGEKSGSLENMLDRIATYKEKNELLKQKIKKAMKYPIAVILASLIVTVILMLKVVPVFSDLFESFGGDLPYFTQLIVNLSEFTKKYWLILGATGLGVYIIIGHLIKTSKAFQHLLQRLSLRMPIFGDLIYKGIIARFSQTLATTFAAGVPLIEALESASKASGNIVYEEIIMDIRSDVIDGQQLYFAMKTSCMFPTMAIQLTSIGEQSGELEGMLQKVATFYESEVDNAVDGLTSMMEPLIMCVLGVLVGGLVVAMYLPIFQMGSVV